MGIEEKYLTEKTESGRSIEDRLTEIMEELAQVLDYVDTEMAAGEIDKVLAKRTMSELNKAIGALDRAWDISKRL